MTSTDCPNPIVKRTPLRAYPGWVVRQYKDGMMDATDGLGLTGGSRIFAEVVAMVRVDTHPVFAALSPEARTTITKSASVAPAWPIYEGYLQEGGE